MMGSVFRKMRAKGLPVAALCILASGMVSLAPAAEPAPAPDDDEVARFCSNIADAARDRRYALQEEKLTALKSEVDQRIEALEKKRAEYEEWLKRRDDFLTEAKDDLVAIYSSMRPDAAAERLAQVRSDLAAAIVMKLEPRVAGVILNEMDTKSAATLTGIMADAARRKDPS